SDADAALTYAELDAAANRLAHLLMERGLCPGQRVGVLLERSVEAIIAMLAVWKAGGVYLPLDSHHPAQRLNFMLGDASPSLLVVRKGLPEAVAAAGARLLDLELERELVEAQS